MGLPQILLGLFCAFTVAAGQVFLKKAAAHFETLDTVLSVEAVSPSLVAGGFLYVAGMGAYLWLLRTVDLSIAYLFVLLGAVLVPVLATVVFGDSLGVRYAVGFAVVLVGLAIISL